jgi:hypothetical protein
MRHTANGLAYTMASYAFSSERFFLGVCAVMFLKIRQSYALLVEDLKPVRGYELGETLDADELVYFVERDVECVVLADVRIGEHPQLRKAA